MGVGRVVVAVKQFYWYAEVTGAEAGLGTVGCGRCFWIKADVDTNIGSGRRNRTIAGARI